MMLFETREYDKINKYITSQFICGLKSQPGEKLRSDYVHVNMLCFEID